MKEKLKKRVAKLQKHNAKLRKSAIIGKSTEKPMNWVDVRIVTSRRQYVKWSFRPTFKKGKKIVMEQYQKRKIRIHLNKPIYIGKSILDLRKALI